MRVQRHRDVVPRFPQLFLDLPHALAHAADRVVLAGDQVDRQLLRQAAVPFVGVDGVQQRAEVYVPLHRERKAAERVVHEAVDLLFLARHPVEIGAVRLELPVVRAGHDLREVRQLRPRPLRFFQHLEIRALRTPDALRDAGARAHEHGRRERRAVRRRKLAGDERAHAVAHQEIRQVGVFLPQDRLQVAHILHHVVQAAPVPEVAVQRARGDAPPVAEMVVDRNDHAALRHVFAERLVQRAVLRHAVRDLQHGDGRRIRFIQPRENLVFCRTGIKGEFGCPHSFQPLRLD